ncbi:MAG: hypothetical protein WCK51_07425 [Armatimonadota bacterium]
MKKIILSLVVAVVACASFAQGGGGRQGGMMGRMGMDSPLMILMREDLKESIYADLGLSDDQKLKLAEYFAPDAMRERFMSVMQNSGMSFEDMRSEEGRKKMQEIMGKQQESMKKEIEGMMTPDQVKRLSQIYLQVSGFRSVLNKDVAKALEITSAQQEKIDGLQKASGEAMTALMQKMRDQEITREEMQEKQKKNGEIMNTELGKILTENQKAKLSEMGGKKFVHKEG